MTSTLTMTATPRTAVELFGLGPGGTSTRDRLIDAALNLFMECGFHAVGLDRILAEVGVTKTTFYNHFESKDQLAVEALARRDQIDMLFYTQHIVERGGDDPADQLLAVFDVLHDYFTQEQFHGCIFINACAEFPMPGDPIHAQAAEHYERAGDILETLAERAKLKDPAAIARQWLILLQGAISQRLVLGDDGAAQDARAIAQQLIDAAKAD